MIRMCSFPAFLGSMVIKSKQNRSIRLLVIFDLASHLDHYKHPYIPYTSYRFLPNWLHPSTEYSSEIILWQELLYGPFLDDHAHHGTVSYIGSCILAAKLTDGKWSYHACIYGGVPLSSTHIYLIDKGTS